MPEEGEEREEQRKKRKKGWAPMGGPEGWGPELWETQNFALSFPSPATFFFLSSLSWVSSRGIVVVFLKCRDHQMCTFGVLGLSCEAPAAPNEHWPE